MEARNIFSLFVVLGIGFGIGMLASSRGGGGIDDEQLERAVAEARAECDARLRLAENARPEPTPVTPAPPRPRQTTVSGPQGSTVSGQELVERLARQKGIPSRLPPEDPNSATANPVSPVEPPSLDLQPSTGDAPQSPPFPRVSGLNSSPTASGWLVTGSVSNQSSGTCRSASVMIEAVDDRGLSLGRIGASVQPAELGPYESGRFEAQFHSSQPPTRFEASASCR